MRNDIQLKYLLPVLLLLISCAEKVTSESLHLLNRVLHFGWVYGMDSFYFFHY